MARLGTYVYTGALGGSCPGCGGNRATFSLDASGPSVFSSFAQGQFNGPAADEFPASFTLQLFSTTGSRPMPPPLPVSRWARRLGPRS